MKTDLDFMKEAYQQALRAYKIDEVPIGAILVDEQGKVVARGYNQVEKKQSGQAHAEMLALDKAARIKNNWRLSSLTLYVTLQPCLMCLGALYLSRVSRVVMVLFLKSMVFYRNRLSILDCIKICIPPWNLYTMNRLKIITIIFSKKEECWKW